MRRLIIISILLTLSAAFELHAQAPVDSKEQKLADDFIRRLNALSDWHLTPEGKESPELAQVVNNMMELYAPDALAEVPPNDEEQIGQIVLRGSDNVRKWVEKIARTQVRLLYLLKRQTAGASGQYEGWRLVYSVPLPWGGQGIAFQIIGTYSLRENRRRYTAPGAVFIQYGEDGKIRRLRLLLGEVSEVVPL